MNTERIRDLCKQLDVKVALLKDLQCEYGDLHTNGHQNTTSISVKNRDFALTMNGGREHGWRAVDVRGMEMVLLGVKKVYFQWIEQVKQEVRQLENKIRAESRGEQA